MQNQNHYIFYKATSKLNGKVYIGMTGNTLQERKEDYKEEMKKQKKRKFVRALGYFGMDRFTWEEIKTPKTFYKTGGSQDYNKGEFEALGEEMRLIEQFVKEKGSKNVYNEIQNWREFYKQNPDKKTRWSKYEPRVVEKQTIIERPVIIEKPVVVTKEVVREVEKPVIVEKQVIREKSAPQHNMGIPQPATVATPAPNHRVLSPLQIAFIVIVAVVCSSAIFIFVRSGSTDDIDADIQFSTCEEAKQEGYKDLTLQQVREFGIDTFDGDDDGIYCE